MNTAIAGSTALFMACLFGLPFVVVIALIDTHRRHFWIDSLWLLGGYVAFAFLLGVAVLWSP